MDFSVLVKGVQDFWDFIWPPIFCLIALVGITYYVAPLTFSKMLSKLWSTRGELVQMPVRSAVGFVPPHP